MRMLPKVLADQRPRKRVQTPCARQGNCWRNCPNTIICMPKKRDKDCCGWLGAPGNQGVAGPVLGHGMPWAELTRDKSLPSWQFLSPNCVLTKGLGGKHLIAGLLSRYMLPHGLSVRRCPNVLPPGPLNPARIPSCTRAYEAGFDVHVASACRRGKGWIDVPSRIAE